MADLVETGSWTFVQSCARMMSAAWINQQIAETSTVHPDAGTSAMAWELRHTFASDVAMPFELATKALLQGLSTNEDGQPQVPRSHYQTRELWPEVPISVRNEVDQTAEATVCGEYGDHYKGRVLPFSDYLQKHEAFFDGTVDSRYGIAGADRCKSDHIFVVDARWMQIESGEHNGKACVDGKGVLMAYWWSIMKKAHVLRWRQEDCDKDARLASDRDEAWKLVERARTQMVASPVPGSPVPTKIAQG